MYYITSTYIDLLCNKTMHIKPKHIYNINWVWFVYKECINILILWVPPVTFWHEDNSYNKRVVFLYKNWTLNLKNNNLFPRINKKIYKNVGTVWKNCMNIRNLLLKWKKNLFLSTKKNIIYIYIYIYI